MSLAGIEKNRIVTLKGVRNFDKLSYLVHRMSGWVGGVCVLQTQNGQRLPAPFLGFSTITVQSVAGRIRRNTDRWGRAQMKGKEKEKCNHHLPLSWVPHQSNSPGVRRMTHGVFYRWTLGLDSHRLAHLSVTQMFCLVFCSQQGNSSALLGDHLQMFNQRETLLPHWE